MLKIVTETEPNEDVHSLIKNLQQKSHSTNQPFVPTEYTHVAMEVTSAIKELEQQKRIFEGIPNIDSFIEPEAEKEVEIMPVHTDDELVAEVLREQVIKRGGIEEKEDNSEGEDEDGELEMGTREVLASMAKL